VHRCGRVGARVARHHDLVAEPVAGPRGRLHTDAELGLVAQAPHPSDPRKTLLSLTDAGGERLEDERTRRVDTLAAAMRDHLTADEIRTLRRAAALMERLARAL
jgi:hypothetical protein